MAYRSVFRAQFPIRLKGNASCAYHLGTEVTLCCEKCSELACIRCIASVHEGHVLESLDDVIPLKKDKLTSYIDRLEQNDLKQFKSEIASIDEKIKNNEAAFKIHEQEIQRQYIKVKEELDFVASKMLSECKQLEKENVERLKMYKREMEERIEILNIQIQECKQAIASGTSAQIFDSAKTIDTLPEIQLNLCTLNLTPNKYPMGYLELAIGKITTSVYKLVNSSHLSEFPSYRPSPSARTASFHDEQAGQMRVMHEIRSSLANVSAISANKIGCAWICDRNAASIAYCRSNSTHCPASAVSTRLYDISISPKSGKLWASSEEGNKILELSSDNKSTVRLTTESKPLCLCITWEDNILVGMANKITSYTPTGTVAISTETPGTTRVFTPTRLAECIKTKNIAVVDKDAIRDGGKRCPHILVMDSSFQELFRYRGERRDENASSAESGLFNPCDVDFDSGGNIVIGDYDRKCIILLNSKGEFLTTLFTDKWNIVALSVNKNDQIWAVFHYGPYPNYKIKLLEQICQ